MTNTTIFDVCECILAINGEPLVSIKLQKLSYYAQAWSLVWTEEPMFQEEFRAETHGARNPELFAFYKGRFKIKSSSNHYNITKTQKEIVEKVLDFYGKYTSIQLCDLNRNEEPWVKAVERGGYGSIISLADMHEYYSGLHF